MNIFRNEDIDTDAWQSFVVRNTHSTPFQTREFYRLVNSVQGLAAEAIAISDQTAIRALAVITKQAEPGLIGILSRRYIIYGGPLVDSDSPEALKLLLQQIEFIASKAVIYTETRNFSDYSEFKDIFLGSGYVYKPYLNFIIRTEETNVVLKNFSNSRRRQINKALAGGVSWGVAESIEEVRSFYNLLHNLYRNKIRKPLLPEDFFLRFFTSGIGKYLIVNYKNKIIGGIMCPVHRSKVIFEFYICGLDDEYKDQYPSVMATWAAIEYAIQNGITFFDFMGAGPPEGHYGVRDFKARFGGERVEYGRFLKVSKPLLYATGRLGLKISGGLNN